MAKTWQEKYNNAKPPQKKVIEKRFADLSEGTNMFIATPQIIESYVNEIPYGAQVDLKTMRKDIALANNADNSCPVTTSIFLRIVTELAYQKYKEGEKLESIMPFWRVISKKMPIAKKLECGIDFINKLRQKEGID
ncbi:hypothetical protein [Tenacibaculum sp. 190524A02b]|uniref:Uncharacterized protein n=1 Tax=Tenacibaculum vairaonense TaxID=3137860 RepID=A0ABM9PKF1_9FLAO